MKKVVTQTAGGICTALLLFLTCNSTAAIVYFDDFNDSDKVGSPVGIGGDNPTTATGLYGGSGTASWFATTDNNWGSNGTKIAGTVNAFLPVNIPSSTSGITYTLTLDVTADAASGYDWMAAGFATTTSGVYWGLGAPWMLLRGQTWPGGGTGVLTDPNTILAFSKNEENGAGLAIGAPNQTGPYAGTMKIVLDTALTYWRVTWAFKEEGSSTFQEFHTHQYSASDPNPNITHVGIGAVANGAGSVDNFSLTAIPEPSSSALISVLGFGLVMRRKRV